MQNNGINEEGLGEREEIHPHYSQLAASLLAWLNLLVTASLKLGEERDYSQSRGTLSFRIDRCIRSRLTGTRKKTAIPRFNRKMWRKSRLTKIPYRNPNLGTIFPLANNCSVFPVQNLRAGKMLPRQDPVSKSFSLTPSLLFFRSHFFFWSAAAL